MGYDGALKRERERERENDYPPQDLIESRNGQKVVKGLMALGVGFPDDILNLYIWQRRGQAQQNIAAGEAANTWVLYRDGGNRYNPLRKRWTRMRGGEPVHVSYEGEQYHEVGSHFPLTYIVKQPLDCWVLYGEFGYRGILSIWVPLPPGWATR